MVNEVKEIKEYDLVILGAGPAGLTAGLYAARYKLNTLLISKSVGGIVTETYKIENYPGFKSISGVELVEKLKEQVMALGLEIKTEEVREIKKQNKNTRDGFFVIETLNEKYKTKAVILATGTERRKLGVPGENEFLGKGVSYCATCDAPLFKNKVVAVVGAGDSAMMAASLLVEYAKKIYMIDIEKRPRAEPLRLEEIQKKEKIKIMSGIKVIEIKGKDTVESILLESRGIKNEIKVDGIFVEIGSTPSRALSGKLDIKTDKEGYIITDRVMRTGIAGIFAAGDIIQSSFKQVITAAAQGAIAANSAYKFLKENIIK